MVPGVPAPRAAAVVAAAVACVGMAVIATRVAHRRETEDSESECETDHDELPFTGPGWSLRISEPGRDVKKPCTGFRHRMPPCTRWPFRPGARTPSRASSCRRPSRGPREVRVAVHAIGVNPVDWKMRSGGPAAARRARDPAVPRAARAGDPGRRLRRHRRGRRRAGDRPRRRASGSSAAPTSRAASTAATPTPWSSAPTRSATLPDAVLVRRRRRAARRRA